MRGYQLIMKAKEALLSFKTPVRFIFSHSALKEGWDNPNVFQICTLKDSDNQTKKRQEVGRGMRLCVNQQGERQDESVLHGGVFEVNELTLHRSCRQRLLRLWAIVRRRFNRVFLLVC